MDLRRLALCGIAFVLSGNAAGQTLIGEWQLVKTFCEGGKVLGDWPKTNNRRIFDKISTTQIIDRSNMDEQYKTRDCALRIKTNYSITGDQYEVDHFLELTSPKCPRLSRGMQEIMKFSQSYLKENYGDTAYTERAIKFSATMQGIKEGTYLPTSYKISNDNRQLRIFRPVGEAVECPRSRLVGQYDRVE